MNSVLPPGWTWIEVDGLAMASRDITDGPFGTNLKTEHYTESGPRVIRLQNIGDGFFVDDDAHIAPDHFERLRKHEAKPGDVLVAMLGESLPRACLVPPSLGPAIVKADCVRLRPNPSLAHPSYVAAGLNSAPVRQQAERLIHGVGRPRLGLNWLRILRFPLAPLPEQGRIVDAVDSYLSRLDAAVATLEHVQAKLKVYRAAVLNAAVEGRLVPTEAAIAGPEKRDYEPAGVLLDRVLAQRGRSWEQAESAKIAAAGKVPKDDRWKGKYEEPVPPDTRALPPLPKGWRWASLDQLAVLVRNGQSKPPREARGVRTLRISAVRALSIDFEDVRYLPGAPADYENDLIALNDLLFTRYNGTRALVGVCARVRSLTEPTVHPDKLIKVRIGPDVSVPYIELACNCGESRRHVESRSRTTAGQSGISGRDLREMPVPVPPLAEQQRIADAVEQLLSVADATSRDLERELHRCVRLRQGVLRWAFEGKLVDHDPNDEPADQLLARIRAEPETPSSVRKTSARRARAGL
jgi:type I restriction enzyme S subunit